MKKITPPRSVRSVRQVSLFADPRHVALIPVVQRGIFLLAATFAVLLLFQGLARAEAEVTDDSVQQLLKQIAADQTSEDVANTFKDKSVQDAFTKARSTTVYVTPGQENNVEANPEEETEKRKAAEDEPTRFEESKKVEGTLNTDFAAALQSALNNISSLNESWQPTSAGGLTNPISPETKTVTTSTKSGVALDLAAEVRVPDSPRVAATPSKKATALQQAVVSKSVASKKSLASPLEVNLDGYFEGLEKKPLPEISDPRVDARDDLVTTPAESVEGKVEPLKAPFVYREPAVVINRKMFSLQPRIAKTLRHYYDRPLNSRDDSAWSVMHSFLGYGPAGMLAINGERGQRTNALSWMCQNGPLMGRRLLYIEDGYLRGLEGPGYQGHPGQFLAMLAQIGVRRDYPIVVQGRQLKVEDLINAEMYTCDSSKELTFKLIALSYYLNSDATWTSKNGEAWSLSKLLTIELSQPVNGAACGGTHRVMAISHAIRNREVRGDPLDGPYGEAQQYVRQYQRYTLSLQNRNGSFSTDWYRGRADNGDKDRQLQTTGHLLEWLVYSLPRNELADPRIVRATEFLNNLMSKNRYRDWEVGPRGHAIRALSHYHHRVFERQSRTPHIASVSELWSTFR